MQTKPLSSYVKT